jgi:NADP-dependent 3-hydroxy acid dehydrogenase YdfG
MKIGPPLVALITGAASGIGEQFRAFGFSRTSVSNFVYLGFQAKMTHRSNTIQDFFISLFLY